MTVLKKYDDATDEWEDIIVGRMGPQGLAGPTGPQGPTGATGENTVVVGATAPDDTTVLWADTSTEGDAVLPVGGATGSTLVKTSGDDYDVTWGFPTAAQVGAAPATPTVGTGLGTSGTVNLDMALLNGTYQTVDLTGNVTFTTSNRAAGRSVTVRLRTGSGGPSSFTFPSWVFVGSTAPGSLDSSTTGVLSVTFFGAADTDAVAAWAAQA